VSTGEALLLVLAGVGSGLSGSIAGLASLISYPALLAIGLAPTTANVTNTVSLVAITPASVIGSRPELADQWAHARRLAVFGLIGGGIGGALLLVSPEGAFERVVPWLIGVASCALLFRRELTAAAVQHRAEAGPGMLIAVMIVCVYGGYFGAGAGVMLLALLLHLSRDTVPRCNAVKSVVLGSANVVAAVAFGIFGDVRWSAALPLALGLLVGGRIGPVIVRRAPVGPLRVAIGAAGIGLAVKLGLDAYA
jgi:uncharacterized membrane protein YfcA